MEVLRPLSAFAPGTYQTVPVDEALRARLSGLVQETCKLKHRGLVNTANLPSNREVVDVRMRYSRSYVVDLPHANWREDLSLDFCGQLQESGRLLSTVVLPSQNGDQSFKLGPGASAMWSFATPGIKRSYSVEYFARRERERLRKYTERRRVRENKFLARQENLFQLWSKRHNARIIGVTNAILRAQTNAEKLRTVKLRYLQKIYRRQAQPKKTGRTRALLRRWSNSVRSLDLKIKGLSEKEQHLRNVLSKLQSERFRTRAFEYPGYTPRFYDLATGKLLGPAVSMSLPPKKGTTYPHPVDHLKSKSGLSMLGPRLDLRAIHTNIRLESGGSRSETQVREIYTRIPVYRLVPSGWLSSSHLDRQGHFAYDVTAVEDAVRSITYRGAPQESSILQFLAELDDIPKTITSFTRVIRNLYSLPRDAVFRARVKRGHGLTASTVGKRQLLEGMRSLTGADLAYKFGVDPFVRDVTVYTQQALGEALRGWKQLRRLVRDRGKLLKAHRQVGDVLYDSRTLTPPVHQLISTYSPVSGAQDPEGHYTYRYVVDGELRAEESRNVPFFWDISDSVLQLPDVVSAAKPLQSVCGRKTAQTLTLFYSYTLTDLFGWEMDEEEITRKWCLDRIGLYLDPKVVWDLIPFSFLVDWLVNIKSVLGNYEIRNLEPCYTVYGAMLSLKEEVQCRVRSQPITELGSRDSLHVKVTEDNLDFTRYRRQFIPLEENWLQEGKIIRPKLKTPKYWQLLTAAELLM